MDCGTFNANRSDRIFRESSNRGYKTSYTKRRSSPKRSDVAGTLIGLAAVGILGVIAWKKILKPISDLVNDFTNSVVDKEEPRVVRGDSRVFSGKPGLFTEAQRQTAVDVQFEVIR